MPADALLFIPLPTVGTDSHAISEKTVVFPHIYDIEVQIVVSLVTLTFKEKPQIVASCVGVILKQQNITAVFQFSYFFKISPFKSAIEVTKYVELSVIDNIVSPAEYLFERLAWKSQSFPFNFVNDPKHIFFWFVSRKLSKLPLLLEEKVPCH